MGVLTINSRLPWNYCFTSKHDDLDLYIDVQIVRNITLLVNIGLGGRTPMAAMYIDHVDVYTELACLLNSVHMYLQNQQLPTVTQLWIVAKLAEMPSVVTGDCKNLVTFLRLRYMLMNKISMSQTCLHIIFYNEVVLAGLYIGDILGNLNLVGYMRM